MLAKFLIKTTDIFSILSLVTQEDVSLSTMGRQFYFLTIFVFKYNNFGILHMAVAYLF